jgi:hypothetical protein
MFLVTRTPMALEVARRDLPNRVGLGQVCKRALGLAQALRPDSDKDLVVNEQTITLVVVRLAVAHIPVEVIVAHRNNGEGLGARPLVEQAGLLMAALGLAAVEVIDHEQELGTGGFEAEMCHEGHAHSPPH